MIQVVIFGKVWYNTLKFETIGDKMRPIKHFSKISLKLLIYFFCYISIVFIFILLFSLIYSYYGVATPIKFSFDVLWGNVETHSQTHYIVIIQRVLNDVFIVIWLSAFLSNLLKPINPIEFSKYITYDKENNIYFFRYWIMLPKKKYLYNANIKVFVADRTTFHKGINSISATWELDSKEKQQFNLIRGVRYIKLESPESQDFSNALKICDKQIISVIISGTDESGFTYSAIKNYNSKDIISGCKFISIRKSEYQKMVGYKLNHSDKKFKEKFRYNHFDKLYNIDADEIPSHAKNDILSATQVINGQYKGLKRIICNSFNYIFYKILQ